MLGLVRKFTGDERGNILTSYGLIAVLIWLTAVTGMEAYEHSLGKVVARFIEAFEIVGRHF